MAAISLHAGAEKFWSDALITRQADEFCASIPTEVRRIQADAVNAAADGNLDGLMAVRAGRNAPFTPSDGVRMTAVTDVLRLYEPTDANGGAMPLLIYLHGGGWAMGSLNSCARYCDAMAATGRMKVLAVEYRLAPEFPYPAALTDCIAAVNYAVEHADKLGIDPARISVGGDSAGGNLSIATALAPECAGKIASLVLFYPVTKSFADGSESWSTYADGYGLDAALMDAFNRAYIGTVPADNAGVNVGLCDQELLATLPPALLVAAGRDILCDQGREFASLLQSDRITRIEFPGAVHLFITVPGQDEAFRAAVQMSADFVTNR